MAAAIEDWLARCQQAAAADQPIPEAQLFRRMLHHEWFGCAHGDGTLGAAGAAAEVFCAAELAPPEAQCYNGLELAHVLADGTAELWLYFAADAPPLVLGTEAVVHFRSFLQVSVVEAVLERMHDGAEMQIDFPFARLREFDGFFTVCAGGRGQAQEEGSAVSPLLMALAPDDHGRKLAAAFTAQDALQNFVAVGGVGDGLVSVRLDGRMFWAHVNSNASLHGVVFNPAGPGEPIPLAREIAQAVLGA